MYRQIITYILLFVVLVLVQVTILDHVMLFSVAAPVVYIYFIIRMRMSMGVNRLMTSAFFMGLLVDIFADTPGMNSLACIVLAVAKRPILMAYCPRDDQFNEIIPTLASLGIWTYTKYLLSMVAVFCIVYFSTEFFSAARLADVLVRTAASTLLSFVLILGLDAMVKIRHTA